MNEGRVRRAYIGIVGGSRPLVGFLATVFADAGLDCVGLASGAGRRIGLFGLGDEAAPLTERSIHIPVPLVAALSGQRLEPEGLRPLTSYKIANNYREFMVNEAQVADLRKRFEAYTGPPVTKGGVR